MIFLSHFFIIILICHSKMMSLNGNTSSSGLSIFFLGEMTSSKFFLFVTTSLPVSTLTEALSGVMEQLDVDIVPYIVLLVVPVLGRMSDPSDSVRFMATQCFATLIRLLPLEVGEVLLFKYFTYLIINTISGFWFYVWLF